MDAEVKYKTKSGSVIWKPKVCAHSANCVNGLPSVFKPTQSTWVDVDGATPSEIEEQVGNCPSGALSWSKA
ncbi:MAG: (4Fe-4S)-binding protein [Bacteroidetes bacterium]|nr:MAG: (4Fe-4S)-binding protein [Bacteroidota bacterium]